jgi:hypothetical protein
MGSEGERSGLARVNGGTTALPGGNVALAGHGEVKRGGQRLHAFKEDRPRRNGEGMGGGGAPAMHAGQQRPWRTTEEKCPRQALPGSTGETVASTGCQRARRSSVLAIAGVSGPPAANFAGRAAARGGEWKELLGFSSKRERERANGEGGGAAANLKKGERARERGHRVPPGWR